MSQDARTRTALELIGELSDPAVTEPGPGTPLAAIGIDSLAFAELALALEERLGLDLGCAELDAAATVGELLGVVEAAGLSRGAHEVPASVGRLQGVADVLAGGPLRWWLAARVTGAEHVPERGPAVLAMNHESALDIPLAVIASPRRITFMAKRELFENGFASWSLERLGGFRVDRSRFDLGAVRTALAVLARGDVLGMYPEGTRSPGRLLPFLDGAAWIALQAGAPLVPVTLDGTDRGHLARRPRGARVRVTFGERIPVERVDHPRERRRRAAELTSELRRAVERDLRA
jgi:1-acyl-sn-glycerol-3-phosphate acyltransferase